jgi:hypothetical protein
MIGSIRRECIDHVVAFGERHLRHALLSYMKYCNEMRISMEKGAPVSRVLVMRSAQDRSAKNVSGPLDSVWT